MLAVLCALAAAVLYASASVLQHRGAVAQPAEESMRLGLLVRLARNRGWLIGLACDGGAYALQFVALGHGPIVLVQLLLVTGLLFALPIAAAVVGRRLSPGDWVASTLTCAGLAAFLLVAHPAAGRQDAGSGQWAVLLLTVSVVGAGLAALGRHPDGRIRAVGLAASAGVLYGGAAALTKTVSHLLGRGIVPVLTHWQTYVLVVVGVVGMVVAQSAFQSGALDLSLPTMTVTDPLSSIVIGATVFGERIASSPLALTVEVVSLAAMVVGVYVLARSEAKLEVAPAEAVQTEPGP